MSEKPLTAALKSQTQAEQVNPVFFIEADFPAPTGIVRVCTLAGEFLKWDAHQWAGLGGLLRINPVTESIDLRTQSYKIGVDNLDGSWFDATKLGNYNGRSCKIWFATYDPTIAESPTADTDPRLTLDPYLLVDGSLDYDEGEESGESGSIEFTVVSQLEAMNRKSELRYTHEHQLALYPDANDLGLEYIPSLQDKDLKWGGE